MIEVQLNHPDIPVGDKSTVIFVDSPATQLRLAVAEPISRCEYAKCGNGQVGHLGLGQWVPYWYDQPTGMAFHTECLFDGTTSVR